MYDLIIRGGMDLNLDPIEIGIKDNLISKISTKIEGKTKDTLVLDGGSLISSGWIDSHVHCYETMSIYYDTPDDVGVNSGVTTVIDAGSSGQGNIRDFYNITRNAKTNVFALMNISVDGIVKQDELADLNNIDNDENLKRIHELSDFIVGIKARMSKSVVGLNNTIPLKMAKTLQKDSDNIPLMVHIGSAPPKLSDILELLDEGDIVTHCYNGKDNGLLDQEGAIQPFVWDAYKKGIHFDIGHGSDSFNFKVASKAFKEGLLCKTVSTDIYHSNRINGPVYNMATTLSKMMGLGFNLKDLIDMVTVNPALSFKLKNKGQLKEGFDADITVFRLIEKPLEVIDSNANTLILKQYIKPSHAITKGKIHEVKEF